MRRSIWVFHLNTGACNACDIEILDILTPYHDVERLGVKLVPSPRHADAVLLTGPITINAFSHVIETLRAMPRPRIVIAVGSCACGGGIWYDSYSVIGGVPKLLEILPRYGINDVEVLYVPGCPPRPQAILFAVAMLRGIVEQKQRFSKMMRKVSSLDVALIEKVRGDVREHLRAFEKLWGGKS